MARSLKLQQWLEEKKTAEDIVKSVPKMPAALRKELVEEALCLTRIREQYEINKMIPGMQEEGRDRIAIQSYAKTKGILPTPPLELTGWNETNAPIPNIVANSSLFAVRPSNNRPDVSNTVRPILRNEKVASRQGCEIEYSGERLYQSDEDVLLILKELSRDGLGKLCEASASTILKRLNHSTGGQSYDLLAATLHRLQWTSICIRNNPSTGNYGYELGHSYKNRRIGFNLLTFYDVDLVTKNIRFCLNPAIVLLYGNNEYGLVDLKSRFALRKNELAKMLQAVFSSQSADCQHHRITKLQEWSGLKFDIKEFTKCIKRALNNLIRVGVIKAYWISQPPKGQAEEKMLIIWKNTLPLENDPKLKGKGIYVHAKNPIQVDPESDTKESEND